MNGWRWFLATMLACVIVAPVWAEEDDLPREEWQAVLMKNKRVGFVHATVKRDGDQIVSSVEMKMTMRRFGADVGMSITAQYREEADGTPVSFKSVLKSGMIEVRSEGTCQGEWLHLVMSHGMDRQEQIVPWDPEVLFPSALERKMRALSLEPGEEMSFLVYSPELSVDKALEMRLKVIGPEVIDVLGVKHETIKIETRVPKLPNLVEHTWVDSAGNVVMAEVASMHVRTVRCTKAYALAEVEAVDITDLVLVKPDVPLSAPAEELKKLVVKLSTKDATPFSIEIESAGHQRVLEKDKTSVTLEIASTLLKTDEDPAPYVVPSVFLNSADERILAAAREAVGDETDPWAQAQVLRRTVHELITEKSFGVAMATASEVIENKEGDCTEHAVLLAAMARAVGLPSRVAIGLMYVDGVFGYHMWTQIFVDGAWRDVDAVLPDRDFDVAHIRLATSAMRNEDFMLDMAAFTAVFGNLKIEIVEQE